MKKLTSVLVWNIAMIFTIFLLTCSVSATATLDSLREKYPDGLEWNGSFDGSIQCAGFARMVCYELYDSEYHINYGDGSWKEYTDVSYIDNYLKPGDLVRYNGHSVVITGIIDDDTVSIVDCNGYGDNRVHWREKSREELKNNFIHVYSAPYALDDAVANAHIKLYQTAVVTAKTGLTVRKSADINSEKIGYLSANSTVRVCNYPITDSSGYTWRKLLGQDGWVCGAYLDIRSGEYMVSGTYRIRNANGKYLSYTGEPANDTNIVMFDSQEGMDSIVLQQWVFKPLMAFSDSGAIVYRIYPVLSENYSLDCDATNNETLHLWETLDIAAQQWIVEVKSDGSLSFINYGSRLLIDVKDNSAENNADVITYWENGTTAQKFYLVN